MRDNLNPKKIEEIKDILKKLKGVNISEKGREKFVSKLEKMPERKKAFDLSQVRERVYYGSQEVLDRIQVSFARPVPAFAKVALVVLILVVGYSYAFLPQLPAVHDIKGTVKIFDASKNEWMLARENQKLAKGDIIKTFKDGAVDLSRGDDYSMRLKRDSEIKIDQLTSRFGSKPASFELAKGKTFAYCNPKKKDIHSERYMKRLKKTLSTMKEDYEMQQLQIRTEEAVASVVGTDFMLEVVPQLGKTWVGVLDGIVKVRSVKVPEGTPADKATVYLESRFKTEVYEGEAPKQPKMMIEDEWLELEELYSIGRKPQVALLLSAGSTRTRELLAMAPLYIADKKPSVLPDKLKEIATICNQAVKEASPEKHVEAIKQFEKLLEQYPNPQYEGQFLLFIGSYYEYLNDHKKAIQTFSKVLDKYPKSPLASIAQCAIGIIYEEKLQNAEKAKEAYKSVLENYPVSPEAEEAEAGLKRLSQ